MFNEETSKLLSNTSSTGVMHLRKFSIQLTILIILFIILYEPTFVALIRMWWGSDDYSHGFLVPLISGYLVWIKREQLRQARLTHNLWLGIPVMVFAGALLIFGKLGGAVILEEISLIVMIVGLILLFLGASYLKILALPVSYLIFMIKLFGENGDRFHWPFQLLAAKIGIWLLHLSGFAAYRESNFIQLPNITLEVASACSGVRFLVSIIAIGIPVAYLTQRTKFRMVSLIGISIIIAILANGIRVALIGMWTYYYGGEMLHGPLHIFYGVFVTWVGFVVLFVGSWLLGKGPQGRERLAFSRKSHIGSTMFTNSPKDDTGYMDMHFNQWNQVWFVSVILFLVMGSYFYFHKNSSLPLKEDFTTFPKVIGDWYGDDSDPKTESLKLESADNEMVRVYRDNKVPGRAVKLYIGYLNNQTEGKKLVTYTTDRKFHRGEDVVTILGTDEQPYQINRVVLRDGNKQHAVHFWYDINGRIVANRYIAKLYTIWGALVHGHTNGAMVAISVPLEIEHPDKVFADEQRFIRDAIFSIHNYLPDE